MCSSSEDVQFKRGCTVRIRHIFITSEDVQYESGTKSVRTKMYSTSAGHIFSKSEDVRYESATVSVYERGCAVQASRSSSFGTKGTAQKYFLMNESLQSLTHPVKPVTCLWYSAKAIKQLIMKFLVSNICHNEFIIYTGKFNIYHCFFCYWMRP